MIEPRRKDVWNNLQPFASNQYYPDTTGVSAAEDIEHVDKWVDSLLGLQAEAVEKAVRKVEHSAQPLYKGHETYFNVSVAGTQISYADIRILLIGLGLKPGDKIVDLGSGYGRMGFVVGDQYPEVSFKGYEIVAARREEASRVAAMWGWSQVSYETRDLGDPHLSPEPADIYFMYDPANNPTLAKILGDLRKISTRRLIRIVTIDGTGRLSRLLPKENWWKKTNEQATNTTKFPIVTYVAGPKHSF